VKLIDELFSSVVLSVGVMVRDDDLGKSSMSFLIEFLRKESLIFSSLIALGAENRNSSYPSELSSSWVIEMSGRFRLLFTVNDDLLNC